ncbi:nuclear receptor coactivator 7 isoform X1 [Patella vulgata]|uniref:nuclear receptor coactivator 7 isoform X1 n=1 Tax=Patella vulgata TaxID=6465 RepID=UPI0024A9E909|nr:nuclear receptor coactivator 7 isoform X1 [Patella vulgata]
MHSKNNTTVFDQPTSHSYSERGTNYFDQILKNIYNEHDNLTHLMKGRITPEKSEEPKRHNSFKENDKVKSPSEQVNLPGDQVNSPSDQVNSPNGPIKASTEQIKAAPRRRRTGVVMLDHQPEEITPIARDRVYSLGRQAVYNNHREFLRGKFKAQFNVSESDDDADERVTGVEKEPNPSIWYVNSESSNVPMVTSMMSSDAGNHGTNDKRSPAPRTKPKGTTEYEVKLHDTLASIAAQFDTTPSELIKLNKLVMRTVFPQQVLYVPDGSASLSDEDISTPPPPPLVSPQEKIKFDVPLVKMADKPPAKVPGHVERQISPVSPPHDPEILLPHKLSEDEVEVIDKECLERFIKINVKHITDGQGVVSGTLLVTPNAVMFDPNVSDPLVLEHGAEKYGMITPMDMVISAAMYHDIAAMKLRGQKGADTSLPKPQIYHTHTCPLYHHKDHLDSPDNNELATDLDSMRPSRSTTVESLLSEAGSMCSCGAMSREASELNESVGNVSTLDTSHTTPQKLSDIDSIIPQNVHDPLAYDSFDSELTVQSNIVPSQGDGSNLPSQWDESNLPSQGNESNLPSQTDSIKQSSDNTAERNINDTVKADIVSENVVDSSEVIESSSEIVGSSDAKPVSQTADESQKEVSEMVDTNEYESKIGSISYFPIEENADGKLVVKGEEDTENALPKNLRVNTDIKEDLPQSQFSPLKVSAQHLNNFVNYATGLFRNTTEDQVVPDINDMKEPISEETDSKSGQLDKQLEVENAIKLEDKPNLFQTLDKLIPKQSSVCDDPPLYLCLRVGQPKYKQVSQTCPIESYRGNKKKPEYWFSIPREKVDQLYAFFVQWTPDIYGDDDDMDPEQRGFVVFDEDDLESVENLEFVDKHFDSVQKIRKDWEIISKVEAIRRMSSLDIEESFPLPELIGDTTILSSEEHIRQLSNALPPRTIGYPWTLVYSSEVHGFSLKTLYRNMQGLDSPVLLVVEDTTGHIFGAVVNCPLKISDHFYGTGESFLYTFYPEYKVFHWSGENNFFIKGNQESLAIGAGQGLFGLWFDGDLYHGRSHKCDTFDNDILTEAEDFCVKGFEAWAFI